jgi:hypothetical protein
MYAAETLGTVTYCGFQQSHNALSGIIQLLAELAAARDGDDTEYRVLVGYSERLTPRPLDLDDCRTAVAESGGEPEDHGQTGLGASYGPFHNGDRIHCHGQ